MSSVFEITSSEEWKTLSQPDRSVFASEFFQKEVKTSQEFKNLKVSSGDINSEIVEKERRSEKSIVKSSS